MTTAAPPRSDVAPRTEAISLPLFVGFTVAATGGPLALVAFLLPQAVGSLRSIGVLVLVGAAAFVVPLVVWLRYSRTVVSSGGLFAFVEAAAGRRVAYAQGAVWIVSYALYLPYTVDYMVHDLLPAVLPGIKPYRTALELVLPIGLSCLGFVSVRAAMRVVTSVAAAQVVVVLLFAVAGWHQVGVTGGAFVLHGQAGPLAKGATNAALLFICGNLSLFLGGETEGGSRTVRGGLPLGLGIAAAVTLAGSLVWARAGAGALATNIPGSTLGQEAWGRWFGIVVGLGAVASVAGVVVAEYFALTRVLHAMTGLALPRTSLIVSAYFVVSSAIALVNPDSFYDDLIKPSLVALWISQIVVFGVYPRFARLQGWARQGAIAAAAGSMALMGYGLYTAITAYTGT